MRTIRALLLVLALSVCANAGVMPTDRTGDIPNGKAGYMECGKTADIETTKIALQILQSLLPLF